MKIYQMDKPPFEINLWGLLTLAQAFPGFWYADYEQELGPDRLDLIDSFTGVIRCDYCNGRDDVIFDNLEITGELTAEWLCNTVNALHEAAV